MSSAKLKWWFWAIQVKIYDQLILIRYFKSVFHVTLRLLFCVTTQLYVVMQLVVGISITALFQFSGYKMSSSHCVRWEQKMLCNSFVLTKMQKKCGGVRKSSKSLYIFIHSLCSFTVLFNVYVFASPWVQLPDDYCKPYMAGIIKNKANVEKCHHF